MNISYDSYRVFYYAAKYRSFSQAAAALYSNQPNVTRMIRKLESELGCALFFRSPQGVRLTPEGEKLYTHIAVAFESIEAGEEEVLSDQSLQSGIVHIAASSLALRTRLLQVLARYRRAYPHVRICLTNHSASHGLAAVQNGLADFAILAEGASVPGFAHGAEDRRNSGDPHLRPGVFGAHRGARFAQKACRLPDHQLDGGDIVARLLCRALPAPRSFVQPRCGGRDHGTGAARGAERPWRRLRAAPRCFTARRRQAVSTPSCSKSPIPARSVFLFQRKTQPLSIAAKKLRQMLLEDAPQESGK